MRHIHFGSGKLGLGLVGELARELNLDFILCNRFDPNQYGVLSPHNHLISQDKKYKIDFGNDIVKQIPVYDFHVTNDSSDTQRIVELIGNPSTTLLTISLKDGYSSVCKLISEGLYLRSRSESSKLVILACENRVSVQDLKEEVLKVSSPDRQTQIEQNALFLPCIVDRICTSVKIRTTNGVKEVFVAAERFGQIYFQQDDVTERFWGSLQSKGNKSTIIKIEPNLELRRYKKLWLVNGPHLFLAFNALYTRDRCINIFIINKPEFTTKIFEEFVMGMLCYLQANNHVTVSWQALKRELSDEAAQSKVRFENSIDFTHRILQKFTRPKTENPDSVSSFVQGVITRFHGPMQAYFDRYARMPNLLSFTLFKFVEMISEGIYIDEKET